MRKDGNARASKGFVLIVDDSPAQREVLKYFLEANNYNVFQAQDGIEALSVLDEITPALIISDVVMPEMDGYEFCKRLRSNKNTAAIPVILLTVLSRSEDMIRGLECGADSFISKPYSEDYLVNLVEKTITQNGAAHLQRSAIPMSVFVKDINSNLSVDPARIITLMISAYESALYKNKNLLRTQSELKALNDQLENLVEMRTLELTKLNLEKDKFFSIISHDLKSPFQGFLGITKAMAENASSFSVEELEKFGSEMYKTAKNLFTLLKNLLEWAQMQNGAMKYEPKEISLAGSITENVTILKKRSEQKGISIRSAVPENLSVYADEQMLNSVLLNLISNAIKFTREDGKITINAKAVDEMIEIAVNDTGVGMPNKTMEKLFKLGEKVGSKGTEGELSTGLGLLLCKEFVEKHGGKIWAESEVGKGSTFYFTLKQTRSDFYNHLSTLPNDVHKN